MTSTESFLSLPPSSKEFQLDSFIDSLPWENNAEEEKSETSDPRWKKGRAVVQSPARTWRDSLLGNYERLISKKTRLEEILFMEQPSFLSITGPLGSGTRHLLESLQQKADSSYLFIYGSFDTCCREEPFPELLTALDDLSNTLSGELDPDLKPYLRNSLREALGDDLSMLPMMSSAFSCILGIDNEDRTRDHSNRTPARVLFISAVTALISALQRYGRKVIFVAENVQHSFLTESIYILTRTLHEEGVCFVVTSTIAKDKRIEKLSSRIKGDNASHDSVGVAPLLEKEIASILAATFSMKTDEKEDLAKKLYEMSGGIVLKMIEYLAWMMDEDILYASGRGWTYNNIGLFLQPEFWDIVSERMDDGLKQLFLVASRLGPYIKLFELEALLGRSAQELAARAVELRILDLVFVNNDISYRFVNDVIFEEFLERYDGSLTEMENLDHGRRLWSAARKGTHLDDILFKMLNFFATGSPSLALPEEKVAVAALALHAATRSAQISAFASASVFVNLGLSQLGLRSWRDNYDLTLALHNAAAEIEMSCANYERLDYIVQDVRTYARSIGDTMRATHAQMHSLIPRHDEKRCIDIGVRTLKKLGVSIPKVPSIAAVLTLWFRVQRSLRRKSNAKLERLPRLMDQKTLDIQLTIQLMIVPSFLLDHKLFPLLALKQMKYTLDRGLSVMSPHSFGAYAALHLGMTGNFNEAFRFSQLSLKLMDKFGRPEHFAATVPVLFAGSRLWKRPFRDCLDPLLCAFKIGLQTGDVPNSALCAELYCFFALEAGMKLTDILSRFDDFARLMKLYRQEELLSVVLLPTVKLIRQFVGVSDDSLVSGTGGGGIETVSASGWDDYRRQMEARGDRTRAQHVAINRMILSYHFNDMDAAALFARDNYKVVFKTPTNMNHALSGFYIGLVFLEQARRKIQRRKSLRIAKVCIRLFEKWGRINPDNFLDKYQLLMAELASVEGRNEEAYARYFSAISLAQQSHFLPYTGLAYEKCAYHLYRFSDDGGVPNHKESSMRFLEQSVKAYEEWGASAKVEYLHEEADHMFGGLGGRHPSYESLRSY